MRDDADRPDHGGARRVGIALAAFVLAWFAAAIAANLLFGSGNILVWMIAAVVGIGVYVAVRRRDRRSSG
jgi:hypothetical protein